ncbi:MAG: tRNA uridine-5-carboxymethylaminomethyl(34) synthesis GTPase MnmE [Deltaproteobacteria bacterium]|nr:MAG: tRNA uridine-5-carboxymethylaminomethyl(34) synthesis GTPase MnmE [Deltaproteobacteria bacterium]
MADSTIAAISTPVGVGGIGIIRLSGPDAVDILTRLFRTARLKPVSASDFPSHQLVYGHIVHPDTDQVVDEVLAVYMAPPRTYTCEAVVEIHAHGGAYVLHAILDLVLRAGASVAEPGEFTRRAFMNGRIDLTQAESVIDLIQAQSAAAGRLAMHMIRGGMKARMEHLRTRLIAHLTVIEALIDFPDAVDESDVDLPGISGDLTAGILPVIDALIAAYDQAHCLRDGVRLVIAGPPNVGKSSLLNRLLQRERAIVTAVPGTTRDFIEEPWSLNGVPAILTDTAGIRETDDPVEQAGIDRAATHLEQADLMLLVLDQTHPESAGALRHIARQYAAIPRVVVRNKSDLPPAVVDVEDLGPSVLVSAKTGAGIPALIRCITEQVAGLDGMLETNTIPNLRQKHALESARVALTAAVSGLTGAVPFELIAMDLHQAVNALDTITGRLAGPDMLDAIFNTFCIGK